MDPKVLREIAESFYTFFRTGHFVPVIEDLSILSTEDAYQCQEIYAMLRCSDGDRPAGITEFKLASDTLRLTGLPRGLFTTGCFVGSWG